MCHTTLVMSGDHDRLAIYASGYGFKNVALIADYAACHPHALPNKKYGEIKDRDWADKPVAAVVVVETPENWHEDLQVICDLLR